MSTVLQRVTAVNPVSHLSRAPRAHLASQLQKFPRVSNTSASRIADSSATSCGSSCFLYTRDTCATATRGRVQSRKCSSNRSRSLHVRPLLRTMSSSAESADAKGSAEDTSTRKIKVYTRTGDKGSTSLFNGSRVSKTADYFDALGDTDELNAHIGLAREYSLASSVQLPLLTDTLAEIQSRLFDVGAHLATPKTTSKAAQLERTVFPEESVKELESSIDRMDEDLPPLKNFILPGGGLTATHLQVARAVARRAERHVVPLVERGDADPVVGRFLNRLSDSLFVAARYASFHEKKPEVVWRKPRTAGKDSQES